MSISRPTTTTPSPSKRGTFVGTVIENSAICREHFRLILQTPHFPPTAPGQFVQVLCRDLDLLESDAHEHDWTTGDRLGDLHRELTQPVAMLRRPFSLAGRWDAPDGVRLHLIHRVVGKGTRWLSKLHAGDEVGLLGPLGNRFTLPGRDVPALLVGGGVGIPPMLYLAEKLARRSAVTVAFCGAMTRDLLPFDILAENAGGSEAIEPLLNAREFARHGVRSILTTDDGSHGFRGFVTQALERYLDLCGFTTDAIHRTGDNRPMIYTCGPEPMMRRVADIAAARGLPCQIAVERAMACGMGTCQSCCIRVRKRDPHEPPMAGRDWAWRLACTDGPVFGGDELLW